MKLGLIIISVGLIATGKLSSQWVDTGLHQRSVKAFLSRGDSLLAGSGDVIYSSTDAGLSWDSLAILDSKFIGVLRSHGPAILVGNSHDCIYCSMFTCLYRSDDNGITWDSVYGALGGTTQIAVSSQEAFANADGQLISSFDGGISWTELSTFDEHVVSLAAKHNTVFVGTIGAGVYRSTDSGVTWESVGFSQKTIWNLVANEEAVFAVAGFDSVYRSHDNGNSWEEIGSGLPTGLNIIGLFVLSDHTFVTTLDNRVFATPVSNIEWIDVSDGLDLGDFVHILALELHDGFLFAGSSRSVWRRPYSEIVSVSPWPSGSLPTTYQLHQNYPNPFNPSTRIRYELPERSLVTLKVYNVLGQEVATLVNEEKDAGSYQVEFDGASLSSGLYFYRFRAGEFVETRKLLLVK